MSSLTVRAASLVCAVAMCSGCAGVLVGAGIGAGGVMMAKGNVKTLLDYPVESLHTATVEAMTDMGLPIEMNEVDSTTAIVRSHYSDGRPIRVRIEAVTDVTTEVRIRAGHVGSENRAQMLLEEIEARL